MIRITSVVLLAGCIDALAPDVGSRLPEVSCPGDSDPGRIVSYRVDLEEGMFTERGCRGCHTDGGTGLRQSGFDLSSYTSMRTGGGRSGAAIVIEGKPCDSILVQKVELGPPFGRRMPFDGPPYLSSGDLALVRDWIVEGGRDN